MKKIIFNLCLVYFITELGKYLDKNKKAEDGQYLFLIDIDTKVKILSSLKNNPVYLDSIPKNKMIIST
jgi:hypothetical protein